MAMLGHIIFHFALCFLYAAANPIEEACIGVKCPGPVKFYEDLECRPIYKNSGDCCAIKYDCGHLNDKSPDKCYSYGREYQIGEVFPDNLSCHYKCTCDKLRGNVAQFNCFIEGLHYPKDYRCYTERNATGCYTGAELCPERPEDRPTCEVDGAIFSYGDWGINDGVECYCVSGLNGETKAFCRDFDIPQSNQTHCGTETYRRAQLKNNCAPVFNADALPQQYCNSNWRCQSDRDKIIKKKAKSDRKNENVSNDNTTCKFGNLTMQIGDELNQDTDYDSVCLKCICDVPPLLTCQYLSHDVCDYDEHRASVIPRAIA